MIGDKKVTILMVINVIYAAGQPSGMMVVAGEATQNVA
jgi:hypothetical protein